MPGAAAPLSRLGALARRSAAAQERCELCGAPIAPEHRHLLDVAGRELICACRPCSILFASEAASEGRYRLVGNRRRRVGDLELDDAAWADLRLPVDMAFFVDSTPAGRVQAFYPSPMGPTESQLGLEAWSELVAANPVLGTLAPDVEALLVNRARGARGHWIVPIDDCFSLVGLIRTRWRGLTGGTEVWREIARFFEELDRRARPASRNDQEDEMGLKLGKGKGKPAADAPTHVKGIKQGNSRGNYERMDGHLPDGRSTAARSTGINPGAREPIDPRMPNLPPA